MTFDNNIWLFVLVGLIIFILVLNFILVTALILDLRHWRKLNEKARESDDDDESYPQRK